MRIIVFLIALLWSFGAYALTTGDVLLVLGQSQCLNPATVGVFFGGFAPAAPAYIWNSLASTPAWEPINPGMNTGPGFGTWGGETQLALRYAAYTKKPVYIIKHCPGSTGMAQKADPTVNDWSANSQNKAWATFYTTTVNALNNMISAAVLPVVKGIFIVGADSDTWLQADADTVAVESRGICDAYRGRLQSGSAKCIFSRVPAWTAAPFTATVQAQQNTLVNHFRSGVVNTDSMVPANLGGGLHFDAASTVRHGDLLFEGWLSVN